MKVLEKLEAEWVKDGPIDRTDIISECSNIPKLHSKYYGLLIRANLKKLELEAELNQLTLAKTMFFTGTMDEMELRRRGWKPNPLKILRADVPMHIQDDKEYIKLSMKFGYQDQVVKFLKDIVNQVNNRNYKITNMVKWSQFTSGDSNGNH